MINNDISVATLCDVLFQRIKNPGNLTFHSRRFLLNISTVCNNVWLQS